MRRRARDKEVALLRAALAERDTCLRQSKGELMGAQALGGGRSVDRHCADARRSRKEAWRQ